LFSRCVVIVEEFCIGDFILMLYYIDWICAGGALD
jgi:hypothetical protein